MISKPNLTKGLQFKKEFPPIAENLYAAFQYSLCCFFQFLLQSPWKSLLPHIELTVIPNRNTPGRVFMAAQLMSPSGTLLSTADLQFPVEV